MADPTTELAAALNRAAKHIAELERQRWEDTALLRQALEALEGAISYDWHGNPSEDYDRECAALVAALRERLEKSNDP